MLPLSFLTRGLGRGLRVALALLSPLLLVTCTENLAGPGRPGIGSLHVAPLFDAYSRIAPLTLDNVQVIAVRQTGRQFPDTLANVSRGFSVTNQQLQLDVPVLLSGVSDTVDVTLRLFAGTTLLFEGTSSIGVTAGSGTLPSSIPVSYQGPGASVASLTLSPRDTILQTGDSLAFLLNASDSQQAPVAQYYVSWSLSGASANGVKLDASGRLRAPSAPDLFYVKVATPNGVLDSTSVTIVPRVKPGTVIWTGAVDSQWSTPGNWNSGALPSTADSVVIPSVTRGPILTASAAAGAVNVTGGTLLLNGQTLVVARSFATSGAGTLTMINPGDVLNVGGNARFNGGSTSGLLTAGLLTVGGTFTQLASTSPLSFAADSSHVTELRATVPVISFATPGMTSSHFAILEQGLTATDFHLATDVAVAGYITSQQDGFSGTLTGNNVALIATNIGSLDLDGVRLIIDDPNATQFAGVFGVRFTNLPTTATQITIRTPGTTVSPFTLSGVSFMPLAAGNSGAYVNAVDIDGVTPAPLVVYIDFDPAGNGPGFTNTSGGATVFWPSTPVVWTGITSSDWYTGTNWNDLRTPFQGTVVIPGGTPFPPQLTNFGATETSVTVQAGATLDLGTQNLTVSNGLDVGGSITGLSGASVTVTGSLRGQIDVPILSFGTSLNGNLSMGLGSTLQVAGPFDLAGHTADVTGDLSITGTGDVRMTNAAGTDSLLVGGNALFSGGSETGLLTHGVLKVTGNLTSGVFIADHFAPSGTHKTIVGSSKPSTITFQSFNGAPSGRFKVLDVSGAIGGISLLSSKTIVDSLLISTPAVGTPFLTGGGDSLVTRQVQVTRLIIDKVPLTIDELGTALPQQFDNVTFQNDTTSTLLTLVFVGAAGPRTVTFNTPVFSFNGGNTWVKLTSSNGLGITTILINPLLNTAGPGRSIPAGNATVAGATVLWQ